MSVPSTAHAFSRRLMIMRAGKVDLIEQPLGPVRPTDVLARTVLSGISHGTELAWFSGRASALHKGWDSATRLFTSDNAPRTYPVAPGYETVARIEAVGTDVEKLRLGDLVYLDRPHADMHVVDEDTAVNGLLPDGVSAEQAIFYPLTRVALGGVHDAGVQIGDEVVVTGLGVVGLLAAQLASHAGALVIGIDRYPLRLRAAADLGITVLDATAVRDVAAAVRAATAGRGADAVIEASGSYALLHQAIRTAGVSTQVATVSSYHGDQTGLSLGEEYQRNRITLVPSTTMGGVPHPRHPAWDLARLNSTARSFVNDCTLTTAAFITHRVPFTEAEAAYALIETAPEETIKVVLTYDD